MKKRVTTFKQAVRLKELGVSQEIKPFDFLYDKWQVLGICKCPSINNDSSYHSGSALEEYDEEYPEEDAAYFLDYEAEIDNYVKAFDIGQIDELLPKSIIQQGQKYILGWLDDDRVGYITDKSSFISAENKPDLWIKLIENGIPNVTYFKTKES